MLIRQITWNRICTVIALLILAVGVLVGGPILVSSLYAGSAQSHERHTAMR